PTLGGISQRSISADSESKDHDKTVSQKRLTNRKYYAVYFLVRALPYHPRRGLSVAVSGTNGRS
ncbi:MAG: hypothetical protein ABR553_10420, partial [Gammaproteobacteria bacterium]